jgi:VIT1/CCC1 family predicted Fe2+/Mn2+ transporter
LLCAITLAGLALFTVGAVIAVLNGRGALRSGTRQLLIGGTAALLVFGIGTCSAHLAEVCCDRGRVL